MLLVYKTFDNEVISLGLTPQQSLILKYEYYEVFDKNKQIRYGITSDEDKEKIERKYPDKYIFEKFDLYDNYISLEKLEQLSNIRLKIKGLSFYDKIFLILVIILIVHLILGLIFPETYQLFKFSYIRR